MTRRRMPRRGPNGQFLKRGAPSDAQRVESVLDDLGKRGRVTISRGGRGYLSYYPVAEAQAPAPAPTPAMEPDEPQVQEKPKAKRLGGRPPKDPNVARVPCPIDGCGTQLALTRDNIHHHLRDQHELPKVQVAAYLERLMPRAPVETPVDQGAAAPPARADPINAKNKPISTGSESVAQTVDVPEPPCSGDAFTIGPRPMTLEEFAELHRRRLRRDIRKMKRAEKRLARRAAGALRTAGEIHEARRTKERELRRFDRELEEVGRRDHPLP